jgi:hypothetical protein
VNFKLKKQKYFIVKFINILKKKKKIFKFMHLKIIIKFIRYFIKRVYYKNFIKSFNISLFNFLKVKYMSLKFTILNKFIKNIFYIFLLFTNSNIKQKNY